jgi:antitoxin ParD1/3/4
MVEKLSITLPEDMAEAVRARVASGEFASTSEVLRTAVRAWLQEEEERLARLEAIRARIRQSLDDPRPALSADEVRERLDEFYRTAEAAAES